MFPVLSCLLQKNGRLFLYSNPPPVLVSFGEAMCSALAGPCLFPTSGDRVFPEDSSQSALHPFEMRALPEDAAAGRAEGKTGGVFQNERSDEVLRFSLGQLLELDIAFEAPRVRLGLMPEVKRSEHLFNLFGPLFTFYEQTPNISGSFQQLVIPGQEEPTLLSGEAQKLPVFCPTVIDNVKPKDFEPFGQLSEHAVDDEFHGPLFP
jgi:hypothetical protein